MNIPEREQQQLRALLARANDRLLQEGWMVGHKHISLYCSYDLNGDVVSSWALVSGINVEFQTLDFDLVHDWLQLKGIESYLVDQIDFEPDSEQRAAFCEVSFYVVPNKVWRASRRIMIQEDETE